MMERDEILRNLNVTINLTETIVKELSSASSNGGAKLKAYDDWYLNADVNGFRNAVKAALNYTTNHSVLYGKFVKLKECSTHALELLGDSYEYVREFVGEFLDRANYYLDNAEPPQANVAYRGQSHETAAAGQQGANNEPKSEGTKHIKQKNMEILPIDFDLSLEELSKWYDAWSVERYGADNLDCSKYYKNYVDGDRFVTDGTPKEGDGALLLEKATRDRVLFLLCKIRQLTRELNGIGLSDIPTLPEIQQKKNEREELYKEYLAIVQEACPTVQQAANNEPQREYSADLVELFRGNTELIDELVSLSDDEIARKIKGWAAQKDKFGKPMIENPDNRLKSKFAKELKKNNLIKLSESSFRAKL